MTHSTYLRSLTLVGLIVLGAGGGCGRPDPAEQPVLPSQVVDFATLYNQRCSGCHGADGKQGPAPPLHDPLFLALTPDNALETTIAEGRADTLMVGFGPAKGGPLTAAQVQALARGLRRWGPYDAKVAEKLLKSPEPGQRERGAKLFGSSCASCHGDQGKGLMAKQLPSPAGAINDRAFLSLVSEEALRRLIITGRPDLQKTLTDGNKLSMPSYRDLGADGKPLTAQDIADLMALLVYWKRSG